MASSRSISKVFAGAVSSVFTKKKGTYRKGKLICRKDESMFFFHEDDSDDSDGGSDFSSQSVLYDQISCRKELSETEYVESDDTMDMDVISMKETMFDNDAGVEFNDNECYSREEEPVSEVLFESSLPETRQDNDLDVDIDEGIISDEIPFQEGPVDLNWQYVFDENVFELSGSDTDDDGKNADENLFHDKYTTTTKTTRAPMSDEDAPYNPWADIVAASSSDDDGHEENFDSKSKGYGQDLCGDPEDPILITEEEWTHISQVQEKLAVAELDREDVESQNVWAEPSDDSEFDFECDSKNKNNIEEDLTFSTEEMSNLMRSMDASYTSLSRSEGNDHNDFTLTFNRNPIQIPISDPKWMIEWHSPRECLFRESLGKNHPDYVKVEEVEGIRSRAEACGMVCTAEVIPDLWSGDEIAFMRVGYF